MAIKNSIGSPIGLARSSALPEGFRKIQAYDWKKLNETKRVLKKENELLKAQMNTVQDAPVFELSRIASMLERIALTLEKLEKK